MRPVKLTGTVANPQHMRRTVIPVAGQAVLTGQGLLVTQQKRLVRGIEIRLAHLRCGFGGNAAGLHEGNGLINLGRHLAISFTRGADIDK